MKKFCRLSCDLLENKIGMIEIKFIRGVLWEDVEAVEMMMMR